MWEQIYDIVAQIVFMILILLIARYVFLEPKWAKWQYRFNVILWIVLIVVQVLVEARYEVMFYMLAAGLNISLARKKHRIRGFFLVIPIMGLCLGIIQPVLCLPEILFQVSMERYIYMADIVTWVCLAWFFWKGKRWRDKFELEMQYRQLQRWESRLLILIGMLLNVIGMPLLDTEFVSRVSASVRLYFALVMMVAMILTITVIGMVLRGNKQAYYKGLAELHEHYLKAEVKHFQVFQETQVETRRVRHDMKNHMSCLLHLAKEGRIDEIQQYLEKMNVSVMQIDKELHCGNSIADAICNEKNQQGLQQGILLEIDGRMPETTKIEAVDICTIFSNALDNAIEALTDNRIGDSTKSKWIRLEISCQGEILYLRFVNPVSDRKAVSGKTSKADKINHGFGLKNIQLAIEKYQGQMNTVIERQEDIDVFCLEIMLMM